MNAILVRIINLWEREPVVITALVGAVLALLVAFGVPITLEQKEALIGLVAALGVVVARSKVTPVEDARLPLPEFTATVQGAPLPLGHR